ncbi:hypothetical protein MAPG_02811 [Magnaporthiopsis poae ATCC 64411]|uniref:C2H2-type domain-containing protein n=1 Tax=Magnaporthiopsis poae (strain ATCC 64411 / 73-15) TaxID=644358 RepID=A0A0C4DSD3_MAGP6|nr:hypothetical protein MAPG_02811 [Magnaporthiopsis poae ATCC 64411]
MCLLLARKLMFHTFAVKLFCALPKTPAQALTHQGPFRHRMSRPYQQLSMSPPSFIRLPQEDFLHSEIMGQQQFVRQLTSDNFQAEFQWLQRLGYYEVQAPTDTPCFEASERDVGSLVLQVLSSQQEYPPPVFETPTPDALPPFASPPTIADDFPPSHPPAQLLPIVDGVASLNHPSTISKECGVCHQVLGNSSDLLDHLGSAHGLQRQWCGHDKCPDFKDRRSVLRHLNTSTKHLSRQFQCRCGKKLGRKDSFRQHFRKCRIRAADATRDAEVMGTDSSPCRTHVIDFPGRRFGSSGIRGAF